MARLPLINPETINDPEILGIFAWVTEMEGKVPNHFALELNDQALMKHKLGFTNFFTILLPPHCSCVRRATTAE